MRILVINYEYPPIGGGGGFVTRDIVEQMSAMGHEITVITSRFEGLSKNEFRNGVKIIRVPVLFRKKAEVASNASMASYLLSCVFYCLSHFKSTSFDIINTHFAVPSGPAGHFLSKRFSIPNVLSIHGGDIYDPSKKTSPHRIPVLSHTVASMLNHASRVVAQSRNTSENAVKYYHVKRQIEIIPLGIKKPMFTKKTRFDLNLPGDAFLFCTIGRLVKRKNIKEALYTLSLLKDSGEFMFLIIGDGPERENLENEVRALGLEENVRMLGNVSDAVKFQTLYASDCYLSTALHEGFGLVFLEAMECGLPIICHDNGGQTDFLINGKTGYLTRVGDIEGTLGSIRLIMKDKDLYQQFSSFNKTLVRDYYIHRCAEKYLDLFRETIVSNH
ncbi:MAG: glycosyltransferase family 4 protein [Desulfobacteraceae bacterium]|nr:glycosyltransferase family 4 protein [Desulfobacteraceae bacterium]